MDGRKINLGMEPSPGRKPIRIAVARMMSALQGVRMTVNTKTQFNAERSPIQADIYALPMGERPVLLAKLWRDGGWQPVFTQIKKFAEEGFEEPTFLASVQ